MKRVLMILLMGVSAAQAMELQPVFNAQLLGGQYYYNGQENSFGGNGTLVASPYMKLNDKWAIDPVYSGSYQGTKQVTDLVGGGTLFQDSQDHSVSTKIIRSFDNHIKVKAIGGYGMELLRETKDEDWGQGLYDHRRIYGGLEGEWSWSKERWVRMTYDYYVIHFPNYQYLESQQQAGLGRELAAPDVLNNHNHAFGLSTQLGLPARGLLALDWSYTLRSYGDQHVVDLSGDLIPDTRQDHIQAVSLNGTWPVYLQADYRIFTSILYKFTLLGSNQNHYDAGQTFFNSNYYAYTTHEIQNQWTLLMGDANDPIALTFNGTLSRQLYPDRLTQDSAGTYQTADTRVDSALVGLTFSYPIAKKFRLIATTYAGWDDSNNTYQAVYQYHYHTATYLMGFSYAY